MSQAEVLPTQSYIDKIAELDRNRSKRLKKIRTEILGDESLPDLDRAVLGLTGDPQQLAVFQAISKRVREHIGKPIISVTESRSGAVSNARGGFIAGDLRVDFSRGMSPEENDPIIGAYLKVPVKKAAHYLRLSHNRAGDDENIYFDRDTEMYDRDTKTYVVDHTDIRPDYTSSRDANGDRALLIYPRGEIAIGRQAIYEHPLFRSGISRLLQSIEERK